MMRLRRTPQSLGARGEALAAKHLRCHGYTILAGGHRSRYGEIDLIAVDHHVTRCVDRQANRGWARWLPSLGRKQPARRTVVFVEVKTRGSSLKGHPAEAVDADKQRRLTNAALAYLKANHLLEHPARFDVVAIVWPQDKRRPTVFEHIQNAFEPHGRWQFYA